MALYKNPFAIRASENIYSVDTFIDLLSSEPISFLLQQNQQDNLWNRVTLIQSAPGGGKTTLLRMFVPEVMQRINVKHKDFIKCLRDLDVRSENGQIHKCGVYIALGRDYEYIEEEFTSPKEQRGIFLSLLNMRIMAASIRTLLQLKELSYMERNEIVYNPPYEFHKYFNELLFPCSLGDLINWVNLKERKINNILQEYIHESHSMDLDYNLFALEVMTPSWFYMGETPISVDFIFQLDDAHKLTKKQRQWILELTVENRINKTLWIAERMETLSVNDLLDENNTKGRDYERIWLDCGQHGGEKRYLSMLSSIEQKRSNSSISGLDLFNSLQSEAEITVEYRDRLRNVLRQYENIFAKKSVPFVYEELLKWISHLEDLEDKVIYYKAFDIFLNRRLAGESELELFPYSGEMCTSLLSSLLSCANTLVKLEHKFPLYYGAQSLIEISTYNVEQFLSFAQVLYNRLLAKSLLQSNPPSLTAQEQHDLLVQTSLDKYNQIVRLEKGQEIKMFIDNMVRFCKEETKMPTFSYRFVSGFAISQEHESRTTKWYNEAENAQIASIIKECVANNILEMEEKTQGAVGQKWTVFYLSRWVCVAQGLALNKGGWRKKSTKAIRLWIKK